MYTPIVLAICLITHLCFFAQNDKSDELRLAETPVAGLSFEVLATVNISGKITEAKPDQKGTQSVAIRATGSARYRERILDVSTDGEVTLTARRYLGSSLDKERSQTKQQMRLRPEVERVFIQRSDNISTIFSPDGPLTEAELDLLRAEAFPPALVGLLPSKPVKSGDQWQAQAVAVAELTGVDPVESGQLRCAFQGTKSSDQGTHAKVNFTGTLVGPTDQGPTRMSIDGHLLFDLDQKIISYVLLNGRGEILNAAGKQTGQLDGRYELTRRPAIDDPRLSDASLKDLPRKPTPETTAVLFDGVSLGTRFTYPRNWELTSIAKSVVQFEEPTGGSMQLRFDSNASAEKLKSELVAWLKSQKATIDKLGPTEPSESSGSRMIEQFTVAAEHDKKPKVWVYFVVREQDRSVVIACNLIAERAEALTNDASHIAQTLEFVPKSR